MQRIIKYLKNIFKLKRLFRELEEIGCKPWQRLTIFDVGANDGNSTLRLRFVPWITVYAFEPTPELVAAIRARAGSFKNYRIIPKAVGKTPGLVNFNVAGQSDWGCSSLLEFSPDLEKHWPGRNDFKVTHRIQVEAVRLDDFIRQNHIDRIDFLHVDTQGSDLAVLQSLGEEIKRVRAGVIEVPQRVEVQLYQGQHSKEEALAFLHGQGFKVWKTEIQQNEENLYFRR